MTKLVIKGGQILTPFEEKVGDVVVSHGTIESVGGIAEAGDCLTIDASDAYVTPGLFDLQFNGSPTCDLWADPSPENLAEMRKDLAKRGVTSFLPTLITDELEHLKKNIGFLADQGAGESQLKANGTGGSARMPGIHLEGPCLSPEKPGVHPPKHLAELSEKFMRNLVSDQVSLITLAPELEPGASAIGYLNNRGINIALGHSNATYEEASASFDRGVHLMTHTFNALPPLHHRAPGAVCAAMLDDRVSCCIIPDGQHVGPEMIRLLIKIKGTHKVILVTDCAFIGTSQGNLVGSSIILDEAVRNIVQWNAASFADAILMSTWNPAKAMGFEHSIGHLAPGRLADIVVWDKATLAIKHVLVGGVLVT